MIIFYDKQGNIVGTIEGRVHPQEHLKMQVSGTDISKIIIGYEDTGKTEKFINKKGKEQERTIYKEHNLHLWKHQLHFEDPKHPKKAHSYNVLFNKKREVIDFKPKTT